MKPFILLIVSLLFIPEIAMPQSPENILENVSVALSEKQWEGAVNLFMLAVKQDVEKAEIYYWTKVGKNNESIRGILTILASHHQKEKNYDKACLFYKELASVFPDNLSYLVSRAEMELFSGEEEEALNTYGKILKIDPNNLQANIFMGNYYFLQAENAKKKLEWDYRRLSSPTRMQYAHYRNKLSEVYTTDYVKAQVYLRNVVEQFSSHEAKLILAKIEKIKKDANK